MGLNYCPNCGSKMDGKEQFCPNCGTKLIEGQSIPRQSVGTQDAEPQQAYDTIAPGYSDRINDPEIVARTEKNNRTGGKLLLILLPLPIIGFLVYALVTKDMSPGQALIAGGIISAVILVFNLASKSQRSAKNAYEATVIDKRHETIRTNDDDQPVYITIVRTTDGKKKKIEETSKPPRSAFEYLNVGDRFRYHPQLAFPYEKYDKTKDNFVYCVCCAEKNDLKNDRCCKCGVPLLK